MVDFNKQKAQIGPRRRLAERLGSELILNGSMNYTVVVE